MKSLHSRDASVLTMIEKLQGIASSQKLSLNEITENIEAQLRGDSTSLVRNDSVVYVDRGVVQGVCVWLVY